MNNKQQSKKITKTTILSAFLLALLTLASVFLLISLCTFNAVDPAWSQSIWVEPIHNAGGSIGAYIADVFLQFTGLISFAIPILILVTTIQGFIHLVARYAQINFFVIGFKIIGLFTFIASTTAIFSLNIADPLHYQAGGVLGEIISNEVLNIFGYKSVITASIVLLIISMICVTLLTGVSWIKIMESIGDAVITASLKVVFFIYAIVEFIFNLKNPKTLDEPEILEFDVNKNDKPIKNDEELEEATFDDFIANDEMVEDHLINENAPLIKEPSQIIDLEDIQPKTVSAEESEVNSDYYTPLSHDEMSQNEKPIINNQTKEPASEIKSSEALFNVKQIQASKANYKIDTEPKILDTEEFIKLHVKPEKQIEPEIQEHADFVKDEPLQQIHDQEVNQLQITNEDENKALDDEADNDVIQGFSRSEFQESLIHPLLQKKIKPLVKPTTPLPSLDLLMTDNSLKIKTDPADLKKRAQQIEKCLADYKIHAKVVDYVQGPVITRFEISLAPGVKASKISALDKDIARSMSLQSVRVVEVIPGKPYVGIELPNTHRETVYFRDVLDSDAFKNASFPLTIVLGKDIYGESIVADLAKMPHLLVAGTTGSGKSVGVNAMILSILFKSQPSDVRFIMIDPKMLELSVYRGIPHLLTDVVTDMKDASNALNWCVNEMERRYKLMSILGVRNISGYNDKIKLAEQMERPIPDPLWKPNDSMDNEMPTLKKLPYIVVMVDEFADLIMSAGKKIEELIARLAQKARAAGIHLVLATQRPSVDVITGLIKANITTRVAFTVSSKIDSRTILDQMGAESLLGMGDMLYLAPNSSVPVRVHGAFVQDKEVHKVVEDWHARGLPVEYIETITRSSDDAVSEDDEPLDPLFDQVVEFVIEKQKASISSVQRQFRIGYNRAARIVEQMEAQGIVSEQSHNGNREVLAPSHH